uniref:Membrane-associated protein n=1 Tax=Romanomermis culicivorax TaxID=13658 RepID=A0A915JRF9_ROMCU
MRSRLTNCCVHFYQSVDCTAACYFVIAIVMVVVGVVVTLATAKEKLINDEAGTIAQLWIVGPIFVSSGLLVLIKSVSHVYKKMRRSMRHQLGNESRHSLRGTAAFPPSYSRALVAPVPSNIVEVDDDQISYSITKDVAVGGDLAFTTPGGNADVGSPQDIDSCKNVTIVCNDEPSPPSYTEAIEMIKRKSTTSSIGLLDSTSGSVSSASRPLPIPSSKQHDVKDAATQIDLGETKVVVYQANDSAAQTNAADTGASTSLLFNNCAVGSSCNASSTTAATPVVRKTRSDTNVALDTKSFSTESDVVTTQQKFFTGANEPCASARNSLVHM